MSVSYALTSLLQFRQTIRYQKQKEYLVRDFSPGAPSGYGRLPSVLKWLKNAIYT